MRKFIFIFLLTLTACATPSGTATPTGTRAPSETPAGAAVLPSSTASATVRPTATPKPSRTPKPTPAMPALATGACLPLDGERVSGVVIRVVDGDTIEVKIGPQQVMVRYLGIDTPETFPTAQYFGPEAKARNRELVKGQRVILIADPAGDDVDRYGRWLRHVIAADVFVNYALVAEGYARYYPSDHSCGAEFFAAQQDAQNANIGMWAPREE